MQIKEVGYNVSTNNRTSTHRTTKRRTTHSTRVQRSKQSIIQILERKKMSIYKNKSWRETKVQQEGILNIDIALIKSLKARGEHKEAEELLQAFRNNCDKQWKQDQKNNNRIEREVRKSKGICVQLSCSNPAYKDFSTCKNCRDMLRKSKNYKGVYNSRGRSR